ncbi:MAG: M20/M25/M40 family metallo-hydrolase [Oscillospiraceae bacterium]|nr:M20/M25/M40 family metallo-hydrolase [Oscillospiraceae bacterium]
MNIYETLKQLTDAHGVAGNESSAAAVALSLLRQFEPNAKTDCHGSVTGFIQSAVENAPTVMLDAHIDQIGLIVTHIDDKGFIKAEPCGGVDRRCLAARNVTIHSGKSLLKGTVCTLPPHADSSKSDSANEVMKADSIMIDAGLNKKQAEEMVSLGDVVTIDGELTLLTEALVSGCALDNRAGVCAVLYALFLLKDFVLKCNIAVSFSVQEEIGCRGAEVTAYNAEPDYAVVVDVSYGLSPGCTDSKTAYKCGKLGKGPMLGYSPALNREMFEGLKIIADENKIPYQLEIMNGDTGGTNADSVSIVKGGVRTSLVSIPLRYMHTPVETVDLSDIETTGRLIAEYIKFM